MVKSRVDLEVGRAEWLELVELVELHNSMYSMHGEVLLCTHASGDLSLCFFSRFLGFSLFQVSTETSFAFSPGEIPQLWLGQDN